MIFNDCKQLFQEKAKNGKIGWDNHRECLFKFKQTLDQCYRNMLWHFRYTNNCERCVFWDEVYKRHLAKINDDNSDCDSITDEDMLKAAEEVDAASS